MAPAKLQSLPEDFLTTTSPEISAKCIDFVETVLPEYAGCYAVVLDGVLSPRECQALIAAVEAQASNGWERATTNNGNGEQMLNVESRNCGRFVWDSGDLAARIWNRIDSVSEVQEIVKLEKRPLVNGKGPIKRGEVWKFRRLNERMRFLKYGSGEYFRPHFDGCYETPDEKERSHFTLHLYLNDASEMATLREPGRANPPVGSNGIHPGLVGGATTFHSLDEHRQVDVVPKAGRILLFQQRDLLHSGDDVLQGVKYTMRTDLLYSLHSAKPLTHAARLVLREEPSWDVELTNEEE